MPISSSKTLALAEFSCGVLRETVRSRLRVLGCTAADLINREAEIGNDLLKRDALVMFEPLLGARDAGLLLSVETMTSRR